jgi:hypothetical protein
VSSPSVWPAAAVGVAVPPWRCAHSARRRPPVAGAGRAVPSVCSRQDRHRAVGGRGAVSPLAVLCRTGWKAEVACPGGGAAGAGMGGGSVLRSVRRHACRQSAGRARSPASPPRYARRAPPRAPCAPAAKCVWGSLPRAQSPTHTAGRRLARRAAAAPRWASPRTCSPSTLTRPCSAAAPRCRSSPRERTTRRARPLRLRGAAARRPSVRSRSLLRLVLVCTVTSIFSRV